MLMLTSKYRAIVADLRDQVLVAEGNRDRALGLLSEALATLNRVQEDHHNLILRVAEFADRALPPPRITQVKHPPSVDAADLAVTKRLREAGKK